jgi:hypothetical protein
MNLLRSCCLPVLSQVHFSVFSPKGGNERRPAGFLRLAAVLALLCLGSAGARAATCTVSSTADTNTSGTLRYCLNHFSSGDTIDLTGVTGKIALTGALPTVNLSVMITGPGASKLTIDGGGSYQIFKISAGPVSVSGLKISGGKITGSGAAISETGGDLTVTACEFANNSATLKGGAIFAAAPAGLTVENSTFTGNSAEFGGAISTSAAGLAIANSTFSGNSASSQGGAVNYFPTAAGSITNNTFYGNSVGSSGIGSAIDLDTGTATISNNLFVGNTGGPSIDDIVTGGGVSASYNVFYGNSGADCSNCLSNTNSVDAAANPLTLPLGYYGGTTKTFLPQPGSQAICAGSASKASAAGLTLDQRGFAMDPASYTPCAAGSVDAGAVQANYIQVQKGTDAGAGKSDCQGTNCTLRDAIALANSNGYGDIDFASGVSSITLSNTGTLTLSGTTGINLIGPGATTATVNGGGPTSNFSVFTVPSNVPAVLYGLTISNGKTSTNGGGIDNAGTLTVVGSTITSNTAVNGGGIANTGTLKIAESTIAGNSATSAGSSAYGGGIYSSSGTVTGVNITIAGNSASGVPTDDAGGLYVTGGSASLANTVVSANTTANGSDANIGGTFTDSGGNVIGGGTNATNNLVGGTGAPILPVTGGGAPVLQLNGIGATVQTIIPLPGSPAICAGLSANIASGLSTDERGYPLQPAGGYCPSTNVDAGAVQTNYTSVNFVVQPSTVALATAMSPAPTVNVLETDTLLTANNTDAVNGIPVTLTYSGTGTASGIGPVNTSGGVATFGSLEVSTNPGMNVTLGASIPVTPSGITPPAILTATSNDFNVIGPATTLLVSAPASATVGAPFSVTVTAEDAAGNTVSGYTGTVHFTSTDTGTALVLPGDYTFVPATDHGARKFTNGVTLVTAPSQTVTATDTVTNTITGSATVTVNKATPTATVALTSGTNPSSVNQSLTFTATVTPPNGAVALSGTSTVSFTITDKNSNIVSVCTSPVTVTWNSGNGNATATCTTAALPAAGSPFVIAATYNGDSNYNTATAAPTINQTVNPLIATMSITPSPASSVSIGTPVTFTAQLAAAALTPVTPSGTVTFLINGNPSADCPSVTLVPSSAGAAKCTTASLVVPADVITATYAGDNNFTFTGTATFTETVTKVAAQTVLVSSPTSPAVNQTVTLTATVTPPTGAATKVLPTGSVTFTQGATQLCAPVTLSVNATNSTAVCSYVFTAANAGTTLTATYGSDSNFTAGAGATITNYTVTAASTTTSVVSSPNPSAVNAQVTFTATVTPAFTAGTAKPTGTVTFTNLSTTLCTETLSGGTVPVCTYTFTSPATYDVVATYTSGDTNFTGSASGATADAQVVNTGNTSVSLVSSPNPSFVNQQLTFNATINFAAGTSVPTGTVTYYDGAAALTGCTFTATLGSPFTGGVVPACTVPLLAQGTHSITAKYSGDSNFNAATSNVVSQTVNSTATTTTVVSSPNPSAVNASVTFTATVTPTYSGATKPTGTVTFTNTSTTPATTLCTETLSGGVVPVCNYTFTSAGTYNVVATYTSGDTNFSGSASGATADAQSVGAGATTVALASSQPTSSTVNQGVTFTATITYTSGTSTPTGTVAFTYSGPQTGILCSSASVSTAGAVTSATCTAPLPASGTYTITAAYSGDTNFAGSSKTLSQLVNKTGTTTAVAASPSTLSVNEPVIFTATVTPAIAYVSGATTPTGTVNFSYSLNGGASVALCSSVPVNTVSGVNTAQCSGQALPTAGSYVITAVYSADTNFTASTGTASQTVAATTTTTSVVSSPDPSAVNQQVTFTATVTPTYSGATKPTGTVTFTNTSTIPATTLCTETLSGGTAPVCNYTFTSSGSFNVVATYSSDSNFGASASGAAADVQVVGSGATSVTLTSSPSPSSVNQQVTFNATINFVTSGTAQPTGTVTYSDGATALTGCTFTATTAAPFTGGSVPACTVPLLTQGTHSITAAYSGDSNFSKSTGSLSQTVNSTATTTTVVSSPNPSAVNASVTFTATVTPTYSGATKPTGTVTFTNTSTTPATTLCSETLSGGVVPVCNYTFTSSGSFNVVATYASGDTNFSGSVSGATADVQAVGNGLTATSVAQTAASIVNQPATFTATVSFTSTGKAVPTGTVTFTDGLTGASPLPASCTGVTVTVNATGTAVTAACTATLFLDGTHPITAVYSGDSNFQTSTSPIMNQVVTKAATTATASGPSSASVSQTVTFKASVATSPTPAGYIAPTGTVTFSYTLGSGTPVPLCSATAFPLAAAAATGCVTSLPSNGTYSIVATYSGDSNYLGSTVSPSTSIPLAVTVGATPTTLTLSSSSAANTSTATQGVTFTATVQPTNPGVSPTGTVTFTSTDGTLNAFCPAPVTVTATGGSASTAVATCTVNFPSSTSGPVTVTATYSGDSNFLPTCPGNNNTVANCPNPPTIQQTVENFSVIFSASALSGPVLLTQGYYTGTSTTQNGNDPFNPTTITATVKTAGGFTDPLKFICTVTSISGSSPVPVTDPSCSVSPANMQNAANGTLTYTVTASPQAQVGAYTVSLTGLDTNVATLTQITPAAVTVDVVGVSTGLTLAPGATGTTQAAFNTATPASGKAPTSLGNFACGNIVQFLNGAPVESTLQSSAGLLTCTGPSSAPVTAGGSTTVNVSITVTPVKTAQLERTSSITFAAFLGAPLLALMGWFGSRKSPRRNFFRFLGMILLIVGLSYATGCGGNGFTPPTTTSVTSNLNGSYYVQVVATDQNGAPYYAAVPLTVNQ